MSLIERILTAGAYTLKKDAHEAYDMDLEKRDSPEKHAKVRKAHAEFMRICFEIDTAQAEALRIIKEYK